MRPIDYAFDQYGIKEISGKEDNPEVLKYFDEIGFDGSKLKDETAWCSAFANWCVLKSGQEPTRKLNARSWLKWGKEILKPKFGSIVVFWRESPDSWKGHVGFFVCERAGWTYCLGGNQANQVKITAYPTSRVIGYREA